jgi:hypothetical protein
VKFLLNVLIIFQLIWTPYLINNTDFFLLCTETNPDLNIPQAKDAFRAFGLSDAFLSAFCLATSDNIYIMLL